MREALDGCKSKQATAWVLAYIERILGWDRSGIRWAQALPQRSSREHQA